MRNLTENFTLAEALHSQTAVRLGIPNQPDSVVLSNIQRTAQSMEAVRLLLDSKPILISSWFRAQAVNAAVGGSRNSAHMSGWAVDFVCPRYGSVQKVIERIRGSGIAFDQIIDEFNGSWVHLSFDPRARRTALLIDKDGTRTA